MTKLDDMERRRYEKWRKDILDRAESALSGYSQEYKAQMLEYYRSKFDMRPDFLPYGHYVYIATPVRIIKSSERGLKAGAQIFNPETQSLEFANSYMSKIEWDRDCETEEITEDDFLLLCLAQAARWGNSEFENHQAPDS